MVALSTSIPSTSIPLHSLSSTLPAHETAEIVLFFRLQNRTYTNIREIKHIYPALSFC